MPRSTFALFSLCDGWQATCPWKAARGEPVDVSSGRLCPLCDAGSLEQALLSRKGGDLTAALKAIKSRSDEQYRLALERLDRFKSSATAEEFRRRVDRCEQRSAAAVLRRPAAAADAAPAAEAGGE